MLPNDVLPYFNFYVANSDGGGTEVDVKINVSEVQVDVEEFTEMIRNWLLARPGAATCSLKKLTRVETTINNQ